MIVSHIVEFVVVNAVASHNCTERYVIATIYETPPVAIKTVNSADRYEVYLRGHLDSNWRGSGHGRADSAANQLAFLN